MRNGLAALLLAGLLTGTLGAPPAQAAKDELTIGLTQFPSNWHPSVEAMSAKAYILAMVRRPFTAYDADWRLTCMLCTELPSIEKGTAEYETRPDGKKGIKVTYTINPKATWGDGKPVTTDDVLFTWTVGKHPQSGYANFDLFARDIVAIDVKDERTFTIHRDKAVCTYAEINDFEILPAHLERPVFEADPANYRTRSKYETDTTNPGLYFGPYRIAQVETGSHVVLEQNPTWWGPKPPFKRVVVRAIENTSALEANLLAGQIDMVPGETGLPLDQVLAFEKRHGSRYNIIYKPGLFFEHVELNLDNPALADVRVRKALLLSIDRQAISKQLYEGRQPVADNEISPLDRVHVPGYPTYSYDPKEAAKLLDEAGWTERRAGVRHNAKGERLSLEIMTTAGNRSREVLQQVLQAQWRQAGVEVRIVNEPPRVLFGDTLEKRRFKSMALFAWVSAPENIPRTILHSSMIPSEANNWAGQNYTGYKNPEMDKVLEDLEHVCEPDANRALWAKLQTIYAQDLPNLPLFFRADPYILPQWLDNVVPTGHLDSSTLWIETWKPKG
ncbi:peptide ABC transporter substrate-binding protein [Azospirillum rugosum]|uniref:Peptide/nickel transport system substrate-binding protein n=1 Tax=Azospirillum rugosum TaxID=416170 RepID=A0ABS4SKH3_9PROT|nr:peptide ABC transporter substrate-binding protein [Azospirillum rugosum]MBP2293049.1 peptide/nickel transport system substrate-binding protein [Azospirillum rugosum]MDQ0526598.1 peptide/nickel transport system substrate-binding protein [Azospirillum rugosum]